MKHHFQRKCNQIRNIILCNDLHSSKKAFKRLFNIELFFTISTCHETNGWQKPGLSSFHLLEDFSDFNNQINYFDLKIGK